LGYFANNVHVTGNRIACAQGTTPFSRGVAVACPKSVFVRDNHIIGGGMAAEFFTGDYVYEQAAEVELNFQNIVFENNEADTSVSQVTTARGNHFDGNLIPAGRGFQNTIIIEATLYQDAVIEGNILENYDAVTGSMVGVKASYRNTVISGNIFRKFKTTTSVAVSYTIQATAFHANYERLSRFIFTNNLVDSLQYGVYDSGQTSVTAGREALNIVISNNTFKDLERHGCYLWGANHLVINGNIFQDTMSTYTGTGKLGGCIYLEDCYNSVVSNNVMTNANKGDAEGPWVFMGVSDCDNVVVTANEIEDPRYGYGYLSVVYYDSTPLNVRAYDNFVDGLFTPGIEKVGLIRAVYDFAVDGGAIGTIGTGSYIPYGGVITRSHYQVVTQPNSAGGTATVAIGFPTDDSVGIKAAVDEDDASWAAGFHEAIQTGTVANFSEDATDNREITITIANEELTAGKFVVFCEYITSYSAVFTGKG
jgi:hypothetical protein